MFAFLSIKNRIVVFKYALINIRISYQIGLLQKTSKNQMTAIEQPCFADEWIFNENGAPHKSPKRVKPAACR
jgi:hypothetical protein